MEIIHDAEMQKFYVIVDGLESHLQYVQNKNFLNLNHTYVPNSLRGKGIAAKLVEAALAYVKVNNLKIIPSCSYVAEYVRRHKEHESLLDI